MSDTTFYIAEFSLSWMRVGEDTHYASPLTRKAINELVSDPSITDELPAELVMDLHRFVNEIPEKLRHDEITELHNKLYSTNLEEAGIIISTEGLHIHPAANSYHCDLFNAAAELDNLLSTVKETVLFNGEIIINKLTDFSATQKLQIVDSVITVMTPAITWVPLRK